MRNEANELTYGNLAYKYDKYDYRRRKNISDEASEPERETERGARRDKPISYAAKISSVIAIALSAIFMITQFVEVNETEDELETAKSEYEFEESVTSQKSFELEQSIDLSKIEQEATTRLGMSRPEAHQTVYLDVPKDDVTEKTSGEVEGIGNRITSAIKKLIGNIVEYFSI